MRCIECEEIELARVRDERPAQALPIPYAALDGFPAGRSAADLTRRRLLQWGVAGVASIYGAKALGFEQVWESVAHAQTAPEQKALVVVYLAGGNDGLNVLVPTPGRRLQRVHARRGPRSTADRALRPRTASARPCCPERAAERWRSPTSSCPRTAAATTRPRASTSPAPAATASGFDTLYGDGSGGAGSDLAVMPAVDAKQYNLSHFDNSDIWFRASNDENIKTGWLGRWLERYGSDTNPLQAVSIDTALSKAIRTSAKPVCAIPSLPMGGFTMNSNNYGGSNNYSVNPQDARARAAWPAATASCSGRARPTTSRWRPICARAARARSRPTRPIPTPRRCRRGCGRPRICWRRTWARASSRSTGARSTRTRARSRAMIASSRSSRGRSAPSRPT